MKIGNGVVVNIKGKGSIGVKTKKMMKWILDVLFVPELDQNLLSVGQLLEHDYALYFEGQTYMVYDEGKEKLVVADGAK